MKTLATEVATPNRRVVIDESTPTDQNSLKNIGKNPATTEVAKAEFAQS